MADEPKVHEFESYPKCPWCDTEDVDACDWPTQMNSDGDTALFWCSNCDRDYKVTLSVTYEFKSEEPDVCEKCKEQTADAYFVKVDGVRMLYCDKCNSKLNYERWQKERGAV